MHSVAALRVPDIRKRQIRHPPPTNTDSESDDAVNPPRIEVGGSYLEIKAPGKRDQLPKVTSLKGNLPNVEPPEDAVRVDRSTISDDATLPGGGSVDTQYVSEPIHQTPADHVYRRTKGFEWLSSPGALIPGGKIVIQHRTGTGSCSLGYLADHGGYLVGITAGHCGKPGDKVYVPDRNGRYTYVGDFYYSNWDFAANRERVEKTSTDLGLFWIQNRKIPLLASPFATPLGPMLTAHEAAKMISTRPNKYRVCSLGQRTKLSCGRFGGWDAEVYGIFAHRTGTKPGDSGGPVFLTDGNNLYPLGVTSVGHGTWGNDFAVGHYNIPIYRR